MQKQMAKRARSQTRAELIAVLKSRGVTAKAEYNRPDADPTGAAADEEDLPAAAPVEIDAEEQDGVEAAQP